MALTKKQSAIFKFIQESGPEPVKRKTIIDKFKHWYYCNAEKHISERLYAMCKKGYLIKPKHGYYEIGDGKKYREQNTDPNQTNLF